MQKTIDSTCRIISAACAPSEDRAANASVKTDAPADSQSNAEQSSADQAEQGDTPTKTATATATPTETATPTPEPRRIETFFRDSKQDLGFEDWEVERDAGANADWHLLMLAYSSLRLGGR